MLRRGLKPLALFGTMFVLMCGGPFGTEELVPEAGPGLGILVMLAMAFVWAVPYALLVAEMVSKMPVEGGIYKWFSAGLSPFWAFQFSYLDWICWVLDAALYPPLVAAYLLTAFFVHPGHLLKWIICLVVIWVLTYLNIRGIKAVGDISITMTVLMLAPLAVLVWLGWSSISLSSLTPWIPEGTTFKSSLTLALIWGLWNYSGYGGLAAASEEIVNPERTYPKVLAIFVPVTAVVYVLPLVVALGVTPDWTTWETAHLNSVAYILGGTGLKQAMAVAAVISSIGLFNGELLVISRMPYAMARDGLLPRTLTKLHSRHQTPATMLVIQAIIFSVLTYVYDFSELLYISTWLSLPAYVMTFASPILMRWRRPDLQGPFKIPGGWPVLILTALVPSCIALYVMVAVDKWIILRGLAFMSMGVPLFLASRWYMRRQGPIPPNQAQS
jgi:amino acid transporter